MHAAAVLVLPMSRAVHLQYLCVHSCAKVGSDVALSLLALLLSESWGILFAFRLEGA